MAVRLFFSSASLAAFAVRMLFSLAPFALGLFVTPSLAGRHPVAFAASEWLSASNSLHRFGRPSRSLQTAMGGASLVASAACAQPPNGLRQESRSVRSAALRVSAVASPQAGPLLNAPTRPPWSHPHAGTCSAPQHALLGSHPRKRGASTGGRGTPWDLTPETRTGSAST